MANLKRNEEFQARIVTAETSSHPGNIFQIRAEALDCALDATETHDAGR